MNEGDLAHASRYAESTFVCRGKISLLLSRVAGMYYLDMFDGSVLTRSRI